MSRLLAIDSATDALSLALRDERGIRALHRLMPRRHQQLLFVMLEELLEGQSPAALGLDAVVYGRGPGSFTGLRIAVSAAQGLAYSLSLPVIGVSSLETQARTLLRRQSIGAACTIFSTLDARIGQLYAQYFRFDGAELTGLGEALVAPPEAIERAPGPSAGPLVGIGSGLGLLDRQQRAALALTDAFPDLLPEAQDMLAPAQRRLAAGEAEAPVHAAPDYVQKRIGWKTLAEQGRRA